MRGEKHIRLLVQQGYQLLTGDGEGVDPWPANLYCPEHLILEVSAGNVFDACILGLHDTIAKDVQEYQRFWTEHLRVAKQS